ncbi:MAG: hypothetical protein PHE55_23415 [Methylococcaceae bacterium]|nr:hypothetical protein [Methylococcaceae bacterium]
MLIVEMVRSPFVAALRSFIDEGMYESKEKTEGAPVLYRFAKPGNSEFPFMLEFFSRKPDEIHLGEGQEIVPIPAGTDHHSLSAILMDEAYYALIREHQVIREGLPFADATALIPLKARAWADLSKRKIAGEQIDSRNVTKHRNDVFRLAATLPGEPAPELPASILADLSAFLAAFPENSPDWTGIQDSLKNTISAGLPPAILRSAIQIFFRC